MKGLRQDIGREGRRAKEEIGYAESKQKDKEEERETICNRHYDKTVQMSRNEKVTEKI